MTSLPINEQQPSEESSSATETSMKDQQQDQALSNNKQLSIDLSASLQETSTPQILPEPSKSPKIFPIHKSMDEPIVQTDEFSNKFEQHEQTIKVESERHGEITQISRKDPELSLPEVNTQQAYLEEHEALKQEAASSTLSQKIHSEEFVSVEQPCPNGMSDNVASNIVEVPVSSENAEPPQSILEESVTESTATPIEKDIEGTPSEQEHDAEVISTIPKRSSETSDGIQEENPVPENVQEEIPQSALKVEREEQKVQEEDSVKLSMDQQVHTTEQPVVAENVTSPTKHEKKKKDLENPSPKMTEADAVVRDPQRPTVEKTKKKKKKPSERKNEESKPVPNGPTEPLRDFLQEKLEEQRRLRQSKEALQRKLTFVGEKPLYLKKEEEFQEKMEQEKKKEKELLKELKKFYLPNQETHKEIKQFAHNYVEKLQMLTKEKERERQRDLEERNGKHQSFAYNKLYFTALEEEKERKIQEERERERKKQLIEQQRDYAEKLRKVKIKIDEKKRNEIEQRILLSKKKVPNNVVASPTKVPSKEDPSNEVDKGRDSPHTVPKKKKRSKLPSIEKKNTKASSSENLHRDPKNLGNEYLRECKKKAKKNGKKANDRKKEEEIEELKRKIEKMERKAEQVLYKDSIDDDESGAITDALRSKLELYQKFVNQN
ncbi:hypothetical protein C9374_009279 [Naegleria lovaniensis]|uniref:Uncharacterized protein n=1 Tax=Naegleria lovaniensis TaxID=51637 RepID=A0AA88KH24_NAELO|nr:uncharacterized protein C9374_009279 [Naegleria lovaniensis]KAG2377368.1 hypothetical protein C9374_009279 [Naegleria lovaniensis]